MTLNLLQMVGFVISFTTLPESPDDFKPAISQAAIGVVLSEVALEGVFNVSASPRRLLDRSAGKLLGSIAESVVASPAETDGAPFAGLDSDRAGTGQGLNGFWSG